MDENAYIIYCLRITGILFILYQDLLYVYMKDTQIVHTSLCSTIIYFKIHTKYYIIIY